MMRLRGSVMAIGIAILASGCGGDEGERVDETDELLIRHYLQQTRGLKFTEVVFKQGMVVVDNDVVLQRSDLLDEIAETGFERTPSVDPQGYYYSPVLRNREPQQGPGSASSGRYNFTAAVPETWRSAFRQAFAQWSNAAANDCVNFTEGVGATSQITVGLGNAGTADDGNPAEAVATFPRVQAGVLRTGGTITIATASANEPIASWRLHTALHEIGHTLGFTHPWNGEGAYIPGTTASANGCCSASYFTVMDYFGDTALSNDDTLSLSKIFVKRGARPSCNY